VSNDVCMRFPLSLICRWDNHYTHPNLGRDPFRCRLHDRALVWAYRLRWTAR